MSVGRDSWQVVDVGWQTVKVWLADDMCDVGKILKSPQKCVQNFNVINCMIKLKSAQGKLSLYLEMFTS